jgi:hypothetical protein
VAIFTLAAAVMPSAMPAAVVQYLVFAIMFSAPAVGVVDFFAQGVDASDCCNFDWRLGSACGANVLALRGSWR